MQKIRKNSFKDILKNIEKKPEAEKTRLIWLMAVISMAGIFCLWLISAGSNLARLANEDMLNLSGLPQFPVAEMSALEDALRQSGETLEKLQESDVSLWQKAGDEYIESEGIFAGEDFSVLRLSDAKSENGRVILKYEHYYKEIPVLGSGLVLWADLENQNMEEKENTLKFGIDLAVDPVISVKEAARIAEKEAADKNYIFSGAKLAIAFENNKPFLVWDAVLRSEASEKKILVGAVRGSIVKYENNSENQISDMVE